MFKERRGRVIVHMPASSEGASSLTTIEGETSQRRDVRAEDDGIADVLFRKNGW